MSDSEEQRNRVKNHLFPSGIPKLWVPLLTFYDDNGGIDAAHTHGHHDFLSPHVHTFLSPGSTGDGWELTARETDEVLRMQLEVARRRRNGLIIGILRSGRGEAAESVGRIVHRYGGIETGKSGDINWKLLRGLSRRGIAGVTVTPPKGAELTQTEIREELATVLSLGVPTALYQLPQVTDNVMEPETVASLAEEFPNFYLFKDTSGEDRVPASGHDFRGVFMVRGAEGGYADHLKSAGGHYDGYLLSTANCFAKELREIIWMCDNSKHAEARKLSLRVSTVVDHAFGLVESLPFSNPFSNANRALDHIFAFGRDALVLPPPMTHSGSRIPREIIETLHDVLKQEGFKVGDGYFQPEIHDPEEA